MEDGQAIAGLFRQCPLIGKSLNRILGRLLSLPAFHLFSDLPSVGLRLLLLLLLDL